ncbi:MAG TPA: DUF2092 domain-containing protein [Patescibacteria group bacterium]|nr:DUF2092 domain-containing protein [Patescibacteria group bacterium]
MKQKIIVGLLALICVSMFFQPVWAAPETAEVKTPEPAAVSTQEKLVLSMTQFMNSLPQFYISGNASYDKVYPDYEKIMYSFDFDYYVKRPAGFQLNIEGDLQNKQLLFNGKTITVYDEDKAVYAVMETPATIETALDQAAQEYGLDFQLLDVARNDFGEDLLKDVIKSAYVGTSKIGDISCNHVVFTKKDRSIQLWIEAGDKPFLRKVVVNFKGNPAMPSWNIEITDWNLKPVLPEGWTTFVAKPGMKQIPFLKASERQNGK